MAVGAVPFCESQISSESWSACLSGSKRVILAAGSTHTLEIQAEVHSTAFLRWVFQAAAPTQIQMTITYSEGYELESPTYPFFRNKADRLDAKNGHIVGPYDKVILDFLGSKSEQVTYEPFWFRTFRVMRLEITVGPNPVTLVSFTAIQANYPMAVKAEWKEPGDVHSERIWDVSIRTLRNCMFDAYSDCPFYEQLQLVFPFFPKVRSFIS